MVKRLALILLLLAGGARATITVSHDTLLSQIPITTSDSDVTIGGTAVITVDMDREFRLWTQGAGTRLRFSNTGDSIIFGGLRNLGRIDTLGPTDKIYIKNRDLIAADSDFVCWGAGGIIIAGNAAANAGIYGIPVGGVMPSFRYRSTSGNLLLSGFSMKRFASPGLVMLPTAARAVSSRDIYLYQGVMDSCGLQIGAAGASYSIRGVRIEKCNITTYVGSQATTVAIYDDYFTAAKNKDTIYNCRITQDRGGAGGTNGQLLAINADSCYIYGNYLRSSNYSSTTLEANYGILLSSGFMGTKLVGDTVTETYFGVGQATNGSTVGHPFLIMDGCVVFNTAHDPVIFDGGADSNLTFQRNLFYAGAARGVITFYNGYANQAKNCKWYYNTFINTGGAKAAIDFDCPSAVCTGASTSGWEFVGNLMKSNNSSWPNAAILVEDGWHVTASVFENNAITGIDTAGADNGFAFPGGAMSATNTITSTFGFVNESAFDYRLSGASPILNCGDNTYYTSIFGGANAPGDPGYYQSGTTGSCGGSSTPTGACCISYTCYTGYTSAQCTSQGGTYQGDGTTTCTNCTAPPGNVGTGYGKRAWATFATLNYGDASYNLPSLAGVVARNFDISINLNGTFSTLVKAIDPDIGDVPYFLSSTLYPSDTDDWHSYATANGYNFDSGFIWADGATACINAIAPNGAPCTTEGTNVCTPSGQMIQICAWNLYRFIPNMRYAGMQAFQKQRFHTAVSGKRALGHDEATFQWQDTSTHHGTNSTWFPFPNYWTGGSAAQTNAWKNSGLTNTQIADSLIRLKRTGWYKEIIDSFRVLGKQVYMNGAAYGQISSDIMGDVATLGSGVTFGEGMDISLTDGAGAFYPAMAWTLMDSLRIGTRQWQNGNAIIWTNINTADTLTLTAIDGALGMKRRLAQERYAWYIMAGTPLRSFLFISLNWGGLGHQNGWSVASDSLFKYCPSMDAPLGAPSGGRSILASGTGGTVYQRSFANGKVLWRDGSGGNLGAAGLVVSLGGTYYPVNYDGSYGAATSTATIRNGEGLVFLSSIAASTGNASIDDATVTEGGTMTFTVTLSAAQSVVTTINYSTANGTALSGTDYTATSGSKPIAIGETSTTITVPTTNRSGCQASRAFTVDFNVTSPATITVTDPTGTGTITDDDCGVTIGKSYKGKIVIKGKVKP